ncbi:ribonuclease P protein component [Flagellimonas sp.]|uniref:ribonuclease P protein component n=1 Tax=Flagellimonas sp. TaxID=2058762 RepID=UPI003B59488B
MKNKIIPYNPKLKEFARQLRKNSTLSEVLLWQKIKQRGLGVQFHRQVPLLEYIVDFYCHELQLVIEIDGESHQFKYEKDASREQHLEKKGVRFIRFSDAEVKNNMFSVLLVLQETVENLSAEKGITPLKSPQGDNSIEKDSKENEKKHQTSPQGGNSYEESPSDSKKLSFPKNEKLKSKTVFEQLFVEGQHIKAFPIKLIYAKADFEDNTNIKVGVVAPKKKFRSAVKRNRIKRLMREAYRLNKHTVFNKIEGNFAFLFLYLGNKMPDYDEVDEAMNKLLTAFLKKESHEKNNTP